MAWAGGRILTIPSCLRIKSHLVFKIYFIIKIHLNSQYKLYLYLSPSLLLLIFYILFIFLRSLVPVP
jgi:hypothetical protein